MSAVEQYQRKPIFLWAAQVTRGNVQEVAKWCGGDVINGDSKPGDPSDYSIILRLPTLSGVVDVSTYAKEWIIKDEATGRFEVMADASFQAEFVKLGRRQDGPFTTRSDPSLRQIDPSLMRQTGPLYEDSAPHRDYSPEIDRLVNGQ